jgi:GNAT superfamily N-acetyltransferase
VSRLARSQVVLRDATAADAPFLAELWASSLRRGEPEAQVTDLVAIIDTATASPSQRLLVAEYDERPAGAVLLHLGTVSSLNLEPTVRVLSPSVVADLRRHGVGHALLEAALSFADEHGVASLATAVSPGARESNRFMARLGFSALATYRIAPTAAVRARLRGQRSAPVAAGSDSRAATRIIAARRSLRRSRAAG